MQLSLGGGISATSRCRRREKETQRNAMLNRLESNWRNRHPAKIPEMLAGLVGRRSTWLVDAGEASVGVATKHWQQAEAHKNGWGGCLWRGGQQQAVVSTVSGGSSSL